MFFGSNEEFVTSNYGVKTTPRKEYEIAVGRRECPPKDMEDRKGQSVRSIRRVSELIKVDEARAAKLAEYEIVAVVRSCSAANLCHSTKPNIKSYPCDLV